MLKSVDLIHFNIETLHKLAHWLRPRHDKAQTMHIRNMPYDTVFGRRQACMVANAVDSLVFITENERDNFIKLSGRNVPGRVIYNVAEPFSLDVSPHPAIPRDGRFKVGILSNYAWVRGTDRVVDVAQSLLSRGRQDIAFIVAGDMQLDRPLSGPLRKFDWHGKSLADYARARGVSEMFVFLGHVADPEAVLIGCDALAKPTREYNPWGRDILEALAAGKPVLTIGNYARFVENGTTGFLFPEFDADHFADAIATLADDRELCARLGAAGAERIARLCDGPSRARELAILWREAVESRRGASAV